jgi:hypothetical protein
VPCASTGSDVAIDSTDSVATVARRRFNFMRFRLRKGSGDRGCCPGSVP